MNNECLLCGEMGSLFYDKGKQTFFQCPNCKALFVGKNNLPDRQTEKERYEEHNNDVYDPRYQEFVGPIVSAVLSTFSEDDEGLDFGSGTGPVISKLLKDQGYNIVKYDPFFHDTPTVLQRKYDYIACCEVIEHFHHPFQEFELLFRLLKPGGKLFCMTELYDSSINFRSWQYKNDLTHVIIYQEETIQWIQKEIGFSAVETENRLISFSG